MDPQNNTTEIVPDKDFAIKLAASLISGSQDDKLEQAIIEPEKDEALSQGIKGAKTAEHYLDIPLKDRPRDPFMDSIPEHLDKPLRSLLGFIDDGLKEYSQFKFWQNHSGQSLEDKIRNVLVLSSKFPPKPVDANAALNLPGFIQDYSALGRRIPTNLPDIRTWPAEARNQAISKDPEAALKSRLPQIQWGAIDRAVITNLVHVLAGIKEGIPHGFRPDSVPQIIGEIKNLSYELLARQLYQTPKMDGQVPVDPDHIAAMILASEVLAPGMGKVADDFPSIFSIVSGLAQMPKAAEGRFHVFLMGIGTELTPQIILQIVETGEVSFIKIARAEEMVFQEAAKASGARPEAVAHLVRDSMTAASKPLLSMLLVHSESMDRQDFKNKQQEVRQKVQAEVKKQMAPKPKASPQEEPPMPEPEEIHQDFEDGISATIIPESLAFIDPDPENPENTQPEASKQPETAAKTEAGGGATTAKDQEPPKTEPTPSSAAPEAKPKGPIHEFLAANPLSVKDIKKKGLVKDFEQFGSEIIAKVGGLTLETALSKLKAKGPKGEDPLLPKDADINDLLNALDDEQHGKKSGGKDIPKIKTALRDPKTGKVYPGDEKHIAIANSVADPTVRARLLKAIPEDNGNAGFVDVDGKFINRTEAKEKYNFATSEELHTMRGQAAPKETKS